MDPSGRRARVGTIELSTVVTKRGPPVAQLGQKRRVAMHGLPAVWPAIAVNFSQGDPSQEEAVAARTVAGKPATGSPFMDIGIRGIFGAVAALRGALDGSDPIAVSSSVVRPIGGMPLPVLLILSSLGLLSRRRTTPLLSVQPAFPSRGLAPAGGATVLGTKTILWTGDEALAAALQEANAAKGILLRLGGCLRTQDGVKKTA